MYSLKTSLIIYCEMYVDLRMYCFYIAVYLCDVHVQKVMVTKDLDTQPQQMTHV